MNLFKLFTRRNKQTRQRNSYICKDDGGTRSVLSIPSFKEAKASYGACTTTRVGVR